MQARYYDPEIGRFLSHDPVDFMSTGNPAMFNHYSYAFNDPVNLIDPNGARPLPTCPGCAGTVRGGVTGNKFINAYGIYRVHNREHEFQKSLREGTALQGTLNEHDSHTHCTVNQAAVCAGYGPEMKSLGNAREKVQAGIRGLSGKENDSASDHNFNDYGQSLGNAGICDPSACEQAVQEINSNFTAATVTSFELGNTTYSISQTANTITATATTTTTRTGSRLRRTESKTCTGNKSSGEVICN